MKTLILAGQYRHAVVAADLLGLRPSEWKYASRYQDFAGISAEGLRIVVYETAWELRNYADLAHETDRLRKLGATWEWLTGDSLRPAHPGAAK